MKCKTSQFLKKVQTNFKNQGIPKNVFETNTPISRYVIVEMRLYNLFQWRSAELNSGGHFLNIDTLFIDTLLIIDILSIHLSQPRRHPYLNSPCSPTWSLGVHTRYASYVFYDFADFKHLLITKITKITRLFCNIYRKENIILAYSLAITV